MRLMHRRHLSMYSMSKKTLQIMHSLLLLAILGVVNTAQAGGIALGATRVIYPQGEKQASLSIINSADSNVFLIQSWIADGDGNRSPDFIITPPLFVMQPKSENLLRIMYIGPSLPTDRESVFYLNSKAIPSIDKKALANNTLQIATQSVIKLFVRPQGLPTPPTEAPATLRCHREGGRLTVANPSPYYVSLVDIRVGDKKLSNTMVSPKGVLTLNAPQGRVSFQTVNDFGATTPTQFCLTN